MIISHKLQIIHIRNQKVGSTSFEMALSKYCDSGDTIATIRNLYDTMISKYYDQLLKMKGAKKSFEEYIKSKYKKRNIADFIYSRIHNQSLPLYIMSNIMDPNYFDFLKSKYDIYRYTDFKELREKSYRPAADSNLLYSVEKTL